MTSNDKIEINRVAVLGAGTMGAGIAAACANAGCEVLLLDIEQSAGDAAKARLAGGRAPVMTDDAALARIKTGSFDADFDRLAQCDWICEAIVEDLAVKREMFAKVEAARGERSIVTTNTSGIPLRDICADMPARLRRDVAVTHFFNPVHVMKLVELVPGEDTARATTEALAAFLGDRLGKGVVHAK
ncbi:MAG: 3-hydroxyacyl-CoA dehydrogenase family protein, partial [bacterium]